ncbi:Pycsar system effector family protein [Actomonas aquatica]|uniref:DUF5706 domain-containing protein n=1 Tax=Actomonas aquatica TaxID=2866162 RepID=A0ABZ1C8Y5_9BACT|nr:Pycsar system effector family protein [Opitutus sp. WL0086]WRQ88054.1 DUF5706 domain-containing protein [Opitutus sp. WL0086]
MTKPEDSLWKIIGRYDVYFGSTNNKAAFLIAYNTFALGAVLLQLGAIDAIMQSAAGLHARVAFLIIVGATCLASIASLACVLLVIIPYIKSPRKPGLYHSIVFYGDVAEHASAEDYKQQVDTYDQAKLSEDLSRQAHVLAKGLSSKFRLMRASIRITVFIQLPLIAALIGFVLWHRR